MNMKTDRVFLPRWCSYAFLLALHRMLLDYSYFNYVTLRFDYAGLIDARTNDLLVASWLLFGVSLVFLRFWLKNDYGSVNVIYFIYLLSYIPFTTCVYAGIFSEKCIIGIFLYFLMLFILHWLFCKFSAKQTVILKMNKFNAEKILFLIAFAMVFANLYISFKYTGLRLHFDLSDVYGLRAEAGEYKLPTFLGYVFSMSNAVLPFLFGYCMIRKHYVFAIILWIVEFIHFGVDGSKTVFYMPVFILLIILLLKRFSITQFKFFSVYCLLLMDIGGIIESLIYSVSIINERFIRRMFFVPNRLHEAYYQFFTLYEPDFYYGSFLRHFGFHSTYRDWGGIPKAIGAFLGTPSQYANNGLFSDAMMNFGFLGMVITPLLLVLVLSFFDKCTEGLDRCLVIAAAFQVALSVHSTALANAMISGGLLLLMFLCRLCPRGVHIVKTAEDKQS